MRIFASVIISFCLLMSTTVHSQKVDSLAFIEGITLLFDSAKDQLSNDHMTKIDSLLTNYHSNNLLRIEGHTDDIGSVAYNNELAKRRALGVFNYLAKQAQIDSNRIFYNSYGELKPAQSNLNNDNRKYNRRVDLSMYAKKSMRKIRGVVTFDSLDTTATAKIRIEGKEFQDSTYSQKDGSWSITVPDSVFVTLDISAPNYFFSTKRIKVTQALDSRKIQVELPKLEIGKEYDLPNLYFKSNLPILLPSSEPTLILLFGTMRTSEVCIHIKGHVNYPNEPPVSKSHSYFKLSEARATKVYDYLIEYGIAENRMQRSGKGNWEMVYPKATKESLMQKNRRVEIEIVECSF